MHGTHEISAHRVFRLFAFIISFFTCCFAANLFSQVQAPVFNPAPGKYQKPLSVTITSETPEATIYYTSDGSDPSTSSFVFTGQPILVVNHAVGDSLTFLADNDPDPDDDYKPQTFRSITIKAIVVKGSEQSPITEAVYVLDLVDATFNIPYADPPSAGGTKHQLDVFQPHGEKKNAVLLFIHGGAWKQGDKNIYMELGNTFAGFYHFTTVVANYQLSTDPWNAVHPTHVQDVALAFNWVYRNIAEYGGDPDSIYVFGQSAGGHLVSLLATDSTYLQAHGLSPQLIKGLITMSGAYDLHDLVQWPLNPLDLTTFEVLEYKTLCLLAFGGWEQDALDRASPATFIHADQPPFWIISLIESGDFLDMPGFCKEADNFYNDVKNLNGAIVEMKQLRQTDIPPEIIAVDFPGNSEGHWEEIYAINTKYWNSVPTKMVSDFIKQMPAIPQQINPLTGTIDMSTNVTFSWYSSKNTSYYHLQVARQPTFDDTTLVFNASLADTIWRVSNLFPETEYFWRVRAISAAGESDWSAGWNFSTSATTLVMQNKTTNPDNFSLNLYPNPFNQQAEIHVQIPVAGNVQLKLYNVFGREVMVILNCHLDAGTHNIVLDASDLSSGVYFYTIETKNLIQTKKCAVLK